MLEQDLEEDTNDGMFLDDECAFCKSEHCLNSLCKYKEIRNFAKVGLERGDTQENLIAALEHIELLSEYLISVSDK